MPVIDFGPRPCPAGCGQLLDIETYGGVYYRSGGPYPDDLIEWNEDEAERVLSIGSPELPAEAVAEAMAHWLRYHAGA
jgi:hypothetical protein